MLLFTYAVTLFNQLHHTPATLHVRFFSHSFYSCYLHKYIILPDTPKLYGFFLLTSRLFFSSPLQFQHDKTERKGITMREKKNFSTFIDSFRMNYSGKFCESLHKVDAIICAMVSFVFSFAVIQSFRLNWIEMISFIHSSYRLIRIKPCFVFRHLSV